jgi:hypothetical protein
MTDGYVEEGPRSTSDLYPLDILPVGHLHTLVYAVPADSEEELRIVDAWLTICNYPAIFERMVHYTTRRFKACAASPGGHFVRFYCTYPLSYN